MSISCRAARLRLLEAADLDEAGWRRLMDGAGDVIGDALRVGRRVPGTLVAKVLESRDPQLLDALVPMLFRGTDPDLCESVVEATLAGDPEPFIPLLVSSGNDLLRSSLERRPGAVGRLADTGHPDVVELQGWEWNPWLHHRVRTAAERNGRPAPQLVSSPRAIQPDHPVSDQLSYLLARYEAGGLAAFNQVDPESLRPEARDALRETLDSGSVDPLRAAADRAHTMDGLIAELYDAQVARLRGHDLALACHEPLDWPAITAAARRKPFVKEAAAAVTAHPDCPRELRELLYATHPVAVAERAARIDGDLVHTTCPKNSRPKAVRTLARRGLGNGIGGAFLATVATPAPAVLEAMRARPDAPDGAPREWREFVGLLGELVEKHLGADPRAWRSVRARLHTFAGTIPDLLSEAAANPVDGGWPDAADHPPSSAPSSMTRERAAFVTLLEAAPDTAHGALLPHLDARTVHDLFRFCSWRPAWPALALDSPGPEPGAPWVLAARPGLDTEAIDQLLRTTDPKALTRLFWQPATTRDQRARILPAASAELLRQRDTFERIPDDAQPWSPEDLFACSDLRLFQHALNQVYVLGLIPQLRVFLHVWETWGGASVAGMLSRRPITYGTYARSREVVTELLAREDQEAALRELRDRVAEGTTPRAQIEMWRTRTDPAAMLKETHRWHWPELLAEHRREPFQANLVGILERVPDCPEEFRREARSVLPPRWAKPHALLVSGTPVEDVLTRFDAFHSDVNNRSWLTSAIARGYVSGRQALDHGHPAAQVLRRVCEHDSGRADLAALARDTLKDNPDAWILALRMLPDFAGSVAGLLRTAALATG